MQRIGYTWVALFYTTVLVFVLTHRESLLSAVFRNKLLRWLGGLAYGTYLIHQAILGFVMGPVWGLPFISGRYTFLAAVGSLAITLLVASLSWQYFELPLVRLGHRFNYQLEDHRSTRLAEANAE
jgi:peptidoglycan/LPS O-acetylase OafA/YrhL